MDLSLNDVQLMFASSVEKFIENDYDFETRQKYADSERGYSDTVWRTFAELGWTCVTLREGDGGFGGGPIDLTVVMERFGRGLVVEPYLANVVLAGGVLTRAANAAQKSDWLLAAIGGDLQTTLAFVEPSSGYQISDITSTAVRGGGDDQAWQLSGTKTHVINGGSAELIIVAARTSGERTDKHGITLFGIPATASGISIRSYPTIDGLRAAEIGLSDVLANDSQVIGEIDSGYEVLNAAVADATLAVCAEAVGIMTVLTEKTIEFSKGRVQFGVPISSFQALQHRMVEMYTACEQSRSLLMWAAMMVHQGGNAAEQAIHSIKYQVGIAGKRVGEEAVQIHGGMGVTWEMDVSHYFKRLTAIGLMFGSADWHLGQLAAPSVE